MGLGRREDDGADAFCFPIIDPSLLESDTATLMEQLFALFYDYLDREIRDAHRRDGHQLMEGDRYRRRIEEDWGTFAQSTNTHDEYINALEALQDWLRDGVSRGWTFAQDFGQRVLSSDNAGYDDYVSGRISEMTKAVRRHHEWAAFVDAFLNFRGCRLLVLFFDDFDLTPEHFTGVLRAIRLYLRHPRIAVVMTADLEAAIRKAEVDRMSDFKDVAKIYDVFVNHAGRHLSQLRSHGGSGAERSQKSVLDDGHLNAGIEQRISEIANRYVDHVSREFEEMDRALSKLLPHSLRFDLVPFGKSGLLTFLREQMQDAFQTTSGVAGGTGGDALLERVHPHATMLLTPRDVIYMKEMFIKILRAEEAEKIEREIGKYSSLDYQYRRTIIQTASGATFQKHLDSRSYQGHDFIDFRKSGPVGRIEIYSDPQREDVSDTIGARNVPVDIGAIRSETDKDRARVLNQYIANLRTANADRERHFAVHAALYLSDLKLVRGEAVRTIQILFQQRDELSDIPSEINSIVLVTRQAYPPIRLRETLTRRFAERRRAMVSPDQEFGEQWAPTNCWSVIKVLSLSERVDSRLRRLTVGRRVNKNAIQAALLRSPITGRRVRKEVDREIDVAGQDGRDSEHVSEMDERLAAIAPSLRYRTLFRARDDAVLLRSLRLQGGDAIGELMVNATVYIILIAFSYRANEGLIPDTRHLHDNPIAPSNQQIEPLSWYLEHLQEPEAVSRAITLVDAVSTSLVGNLQRFDRLVYMIADAIWVATGMSPESRSDNLRNALPTEDPVSWVECLANDITAASKGNLETESEASGLLLLVALTEPIRYLLPLLDGRSASLLKSSLKSLANYCERRDPEKVALDPAFHDIDLGADLKNDSALLSRFAQDFYRIAVGAQIPKAQMDRWSDIADLAEILTDLPTIPKKPPEEAMHPGINAPWALVDLAFKRCARSTIVILPSMSSASARAPTGRSSPQKPCGTTSTFGWRSRTRSNSGS